MKKLNVVLIGLCFAVASFGGYKALNHGGNATQVADVLIAENVEALSAGDSWSTFKKVCEFVAGIWTCISESFSGSSSESETLKDCYRKVYSQVCYLPGNKVGHHDVCEHYQDKTEVHECDPGWNTPCA